MTFPSRQAVHPQLELLDQSMRLRLRRPEQPQLPAPMRTQKWSRRLSHQPEPDLLVATDRPRTREAVPDAEERHQQMQAQSLRTQPAQSQLQQVLPKRLCPGRRSLMPLRLCPQRLLHPRSRLRRQEQQRTRSRTELPVRSRHPKCSKEPSHRQARGLPAATARRLRHGADHGAAERHCSPRRQIRTIQTAARAPQRTLSSQWTLSSQRLLGPHRSHLLNPHPHSNLRQQRSCPPRRQPRRRQPQFQRQHRSRRSRIRRRTRPGQPNLQARRTLPAQLRRPARAAHR